jgi:amino acid adenylation domain-containing protein
MSQAVGPDAIAIVGLAGRFPGAANVGQFWRNLCAGVESVSFLTDAELEASGIDTRGLPPSYVKARAILEAADWFDARFFGFGPSEAEILDPQQRVFLEVAWEALEDAGCDPEQFAGSVGVFAGMSNNSYYLSNLHGHPDLLARAGTFAAMIANEKDYLATRTSYKLNLRGPSLNINTACSTSLVAVCQACHSLLSYQCDLALSGGVAIEFPQKKGSLYQEGGMTSADGHCRAFDQRATGMVPGEGVGVVVLRRLSEALADGDHVYAVIRGFAVNNDGAHKVGYTAPSIEGQAEVIALAQAMAGVNPETISYIEAHGTGTPLGDPIEIAGLTRAFRAQTNARGYCAVGSVKTNIGHLDAAAGVAGLIKTVLALQHRQLPPSLHFTKANPQIDFATSPFFVNDRLRDWAPGGGPRRAGVSSFGIGGTNAHVVLEEAPVRGVSESPGPCEILALSAQSPSALAKVSANLADYLKAHPDANIADVAYTLQVGRRPFPHRQVVVCSGGADALRALEEGRPLITPTEAHSRAHEVADLWLRGAVVDWRALHAGRRHKIPLPTYPFERQRYWVAPAALHLSGPPLWKRGVRGDFEKDAFEQIPLDPPFPKGEEETVVEAVRSLFQELSGLSAEEISAATTIAEVGLDSLALAQASLEIERRFGVLVGFREIQENFPTFVSLAEHLAAKQHSRTNVARPADEERSTGPFQPPAPAERVELAPEQRERVERLIERYTRRTARSKQMAQEHRAHYADPRAAAGFRQQWKEMVYPIVVERSSGANLRDVDGNDYVDLVMGFGANLFGHSPDFVTRALQEQLGRGVEIGPQSPLAGHVAAAICRLTGAERATFCNTGSEAVLAALRIARATTNRDKVVLFAGSYHGIFDEVLVRPPTAARPQVVPIAAGILPDALANIYVLEYGDARSLDFVEEHSQELAAVLVEPVQSRNPELQPRDFLHRLRRLTENNGVALIFDEIITGFRCHPGGAQAHFGVRADIATYGKVLGGGMPIGVVAGTSRFLDALDGGAWRYGDSSGPARAMTYFAGTFVRHPLAIAAADAVLRRLDAEGSKLQETLNERTANLARALGQLLADSGLPMQLGHFASMLFLRPTEPGSLASLLFYHLRASGVHIWEGRPAFLSTAHTDQDLATIESAFAASIAELTGRTVVPVSSPPSAPGRVALPMTPAQADLWIAASMGTGASLGYNLSFVIHARGPLTPAALCGALQDLVDRHEALRTTFDAHGRYQYIWDQMAVDVPLQDVSALAPPEAQAVLDELVAQAAQRPLDLENGPLFRAQLVKLAAVHHALLLTAHHLVLDGGSFGVLLEEMGCLYTARLSGEAACLPPPLATRDYSRLEQEQLPSAEVTATREYWLKEFAELPEPLELPTARPRPTIRSYRAATKSFVLGAPTVARLRRESARLGCGLMHLLLASYSAILHRLSAADDFVVGVPATSSLSDAGLRIRGGRSLVGNHVNLLPLRMRHQAELTFEEHVRSVKDLVLSAYDHQHFTLAELVSHLGVRRDPGHLPLVSLTFNFDRAVGALSIKGVETELVLPPKVFDFFDLSANIIEVGDGLRVQVTFSTDLFDGEVIRAWLASWRVLLDGAVADTSQRISELPLLTAPERHRLLVEWNDTAVAYPSDKCVHALFEEQVEQTPDAVAVVFKGQQLSYRELNARANQVARYLRRLGVGPDVLVGICMERSLEMVIGLLAILKAGGAYVPLDPTYPQERLAFLLGETRVPVLLSQRSTCAAIPETSATIVLLDAAEAQIAGESSDNLPPQSSADNLAYVIYTSGSTGIPKGVCVPNRGIVRLVRGVDYVDLGPQEVFLQLAPLSFDAATFEIWGCLLNGGRLVVFPPGLPSMKVLAGALRAHRITTLWLTAGLFHAMVDSELESLQAVRQLLAGGDVLSVPHVRKVLHGCPAVTLINGYGPTENTTFSCCYPLRNPTRVGLSVPIGRPIANTQAYVLDRYRQPVPIGVPGELYVGGDGLARGYLHRPDLTAERFVSNPFREAARLYKTGDRVRWQTDGNLELLGRLDQQVKMRGFRIELGEVESVLRQHPQVRETVALVREDMPGEKRLVAYLTPQNGKLPLSSDLRSYLQRKLPDYMVPSVFMRLETLPLTPNGKVDRRALPAPQAGGPGSEQAYAAPRTPREELLARIWATVLGMERVGIHDSFFDLGGHSLLAVRLFAALEKQSGRSLPLASLFRAPTIAKLADLLDTESEAPDWSPIVAIQPTGEAPPLFCIPGAGGNVLGFERLARHLGPDQPVYGIQARGLDGKQAPHTRIEDMAACYLRALREVQPHGPYFLIGHSSGGLVAFEMARQLQAQDQEVGLVALLDGFADSYSMPLPARLARRARIQLRRIWRNARGFSQVRGWDRLDYIGRKTRNLARQGKSRMWQALAIRDEGQMRDALRDVEESARLAESRYVPQVYAGRVTLFRAAQRSPDHDPQEGWKEIAAGGVDVHDVPGAHLSILSEPNVGILAKELKVCMQAAIPARRKGSARPAPAADPFAPAT